MKEQFLLFKIKNWSDQESFGKLYDIYVAKIYRFIYFKVGSKEDAQDLTSQTFLKTWQYLTGDNSVNIRNVRAFLYKIARNAVIDYYRTKGIQNEWEESLENSEAVQSTDIGEDITKAWQTEAILQKIKSLRPVHQEVVLMRFVEQLSIPEIAQVINKSNGATRVLIHRALQELKKLLE